MIDKTSEKVLNIEKIPYCSGDIILVISGTVNTPIKVLIYPPIEKDKNFFMKLFFNFFITKLLIYN